MRASSNKSRHTNMKSACGFHIGAFKRYAKGVSAIEIK